MFFQTPPIIKCISTRFKLCLIKKIPFWMTFVMYFQTPPYIQYISTHLKIQLLKKIMTHVVSFQTPTHIQPISKHLTLLLPKNKRLRVTSCLFKQCPTFTIFPCNQHFDLPHNVLCSMNLVHSNEGLSLGIRAKAV